MNLNNECKECDGLGFIKAKMCKKCSGEGIIIPEVVPEEDLEENLDIWEDDTDDYDYLEGENPY